MSTSTGGEFRRPPATISSVSQSPRLPIHLTGKTELTREQGRKSAMFRGEGGEKETGLRGQSAQQSSQTMSQNAQQMKEVKNMLERIKLEHVHSVEDRKTMAELIEKKIHLYQSERMVIEDARVSRLRQQLASTSVDDQRVREKEDKVPIEILATLSDNQVIKVSSKDSFENNIMVPVHVY